MIATMNRKFSYLLLAGALLGVSLGMSSCRSRASRSRTSRTAAQNKPAASGTNGTSVRDLLNRTDSTIARVNALSSESADVPPVAAEPIFAMPRTPWGSPYVPVPDISDYGRFEAGLAAFNGSQYDQAIGQFSQILVAGRPPELVPNAYYWIGESYYAMQRYAESLPYFEYVTKVGPEYKREISFYKLSRANLAMGNAQAGSLWYERLSANYPRSSYRTTLRKLGAR